MVGRQVVGNEIQHQPQAGSVHPPAQPLQRLVAAERRVGAVVGDRVGGAAHILGTEVGQRMPEAVLPGRVAARDRRSGGAGLPDAEEPYPVETELGDAVQRGVGYVVQAGLAAEAGADAGQQDPGVDLV